MMSIDRNSARPMRTWLGGDCWRPRAWRSSEKTMMNRVNGVITSSIAGMKVRPVRMTQQPHGGGHRHVAGLLGGGQQGLRGVSGLRQRGGRPQQEREPQAQQERQPAQLPEPPC